MYLEKINSPKDLKKLDLKKLDLLAGEIREFLVRSISHTGGHLASNLGVVDLTIALHYCFNCPSDKLVWDVGHQAYTHKILTGRKDSFSNLRREGGISGFPRPSESKYDSFSVGHSSTSIAAALGMAVARDLAGEKHNVVAVIGDGAMTGGLAFEALNNAGARNTRLIIVLNDNQMSISRNVGGMSSYLNNLRITKGYMDAKDNIKNKLDRVPLVGSALKEAIGKTKEGLKRTILPQNIFEDFGLEYIGPVDGHNIPQLVKLFNRLKNVDSPVLVHVITQKGKGYKPAEIDPSKYHGVSEFNIESGVRVSARKQTYSDVFGEKLVELGAKNKRICALTAAMPSGTGLDKFAHTYKDRFFDVGIAEEFAVTFAAGLAKSGYIPVFAVYSTFLQRAYDQIVHDVCIQGLPVIFAVDRAGIVGSDGETHQGIYDISFLSHIPGLVHMAPKNKYELEDMLEFAVELKRPVAIRYPRGEADTVLASERRKIELGKSETIYPGEKIAVIAYGAMNKTALEVYGELIKKGLSPTLINARFASPIDEDMVNDLLDYESIYTIEDNIFSGGYGESLGAMLTEKGFKGKRFKSFALPDKFIEHGKREALLAKYGLSSGSIAEEIVKDNEIGS